MSNTAIKLEKRTEGLNPRQVRAEGNVPVTVYGKSLEKSLTLQVNDKEFRKAKNSKFVHYVKGNIDGLDGEHILLIKDIEFYPIADRMMNIQLHKLEPSEVVTVKVPLIYTGVSPLTQAGGILFVNNKTIKVQCQADNIPEKIEFPLESLAGEKNLAYYSDIQLPEGMELKSDVTQVIAKISAPKVTLTAAEEAAAAKEAGE